MSIEKNKDQLLEEVSFLKQKIALLEKDKEKKTVPKIFFPGIAVINNYEKNLVENQERLKLALAASNIGVWEWDINTNSIKWSDSVYEIYGVTKSKEKLNIDFFMSLIHKEDLADLQTKLQDSITNIEPFEFQHRIANQNEKWVQCKGVVLKDNKNKAYKLIGNIADISIRLKNEKFLLESEDRLRKQNSALLELSGRINIKTDEFLFVVKEILKAAANTLNVSRVGLWILNEHSNCLSHICGYYQGETSTKKIILKKKDYPVYFNAVFNEKIIISTDVFSTDFTSELIDYCKNNGITSMMDVPLVINGRLKGIVSFEHQKNSRLWALDEQNFAGAVVNIVALAMEVSERKKAEKQLKTSEQSYYELFNNSTELIYIQNKEGFFIDVNNAVIEKYGFNKDEIVGNSLEILGAPEINDIQFVKEKFTLAWEGHPQRFDWWSRKKNGEIFPKELVVRKGSYFGKDVVIASGRDISDRKQYETLLIEKEKTLSMVLNNIDYLTYSSDIVDGKIELKYISPQSKKIIGFTTAEFIAALKNNTLKDYYHLDDVEKLIQVSERIKKTKKSATLIYRFLHKTTKKYIWIEESIFPQFDIDGKRIANFGVLRNVSERIEAEQGLIKSEERYRLLFESNMAGVFRTTVSGKIIEANKAFVDIFGYNSIEEIKKISARQLYINEKEREGYIADLKKHKSLYNYQIGHITKEGKKGWLLASVTLINGHAKGAEQEILGTLIDITELKEIQETLLESEEKFKSIGESAPVGIFLTDTIGKPEYINPKLQELIKIPLDNTVDNSWINMIHPEDFKDLLLNTDFVIKNKKELSLEFRLVGKKNKLIWVYLNATVRKNSKGEIIGWVGTVEDITQRKNSEEVIKESEQRFKLLSEVAIEGIVLTENSVVIDCNNRFYEMHGYSLKEEVIGKHVLDFVTPEYYDSTLKSLETQKSHTHETVAKTKAGKPIIIETSGMLIPFHGRTVRVSVVYDISERKNIENSLKESERALSTLMNNLPGMAYRSLNNSSWTMEFASEGCFELTGYRPEEIIGNKKISYNKIIHPKDQEKVWKIIQSSLSSRSSFELEYRIITESGKIKWVWEQGEAVFNEKGEIKILEGFITDISERKEFDSLIRQSRKSFKDLIDFSPVGVLIIQEDNVVFANPVARNMLKIADEFRIDKALVYEYIHPN
ncbi:MAG: PAS domain S-box protein, partial [Bacteroidota bacterium]|nr:PAS domain S-box protein [Bacteroidota bacterium]